jgi:hypothetical protein
MTKNNVNLIRIARIRIICHLKSLFTGPRLPRATSHTNNNLPLIYQSLHLNVQYLLDIPQFSGEAWQEGLRVVSGDYAMLDARCWDAG